MSWRPHIAHLHDVAALETLIALSVRKLQLGYYSSAQIEAALGNVFGVDRQLIEDRTYYVVEENQQLIAAGGWSKRKSLFGSDHGRAMPDAELDPQQEAARIRAFFVHPEWARRGLGRALLESCESAIQEAGFRTIDLVATLAGEPLYAKFGYTVVQRYEVPIPNGLKLPVVRMTKSTKGPPPP